MINPQISTRSSQILSSMYQLYIDIYLIKKYLYVIDEE